MPKESLYRILEVLRQSGVETVDITFNSFGDYYTVKTRQYDEEVGAEDLGIAPGTKFEDLPEDFACPLCGAGKEVFEEA